MRSSVPLVGGAEHVPVLDRVEHAIAPDLDAEDVVVA
jgi:hypothetical protein